MRSAQNVPRTTTPQVGPGSLRRLWAALRRPEVALRDPEYFIWAALRAPGSKLLAQQRTLAGAGGQPRIHAILRRRPGDALDAARTRAALVGQTLSPSALHELDGHQDARLTLRSIPKSELVVVLDAGDTLGQHALFALASAATLGAQVVYADCDRIGSDGAREAPHFKSAWSPEELISHDFLGRGAAYSPTLLAEAWSMDSAAASRAVLARAERVAHVPDVLFHLRGEPSALPEAGGSPPSTAGARVAAIIPTKDKPALLDACLRSLDRFANDATLEVVIVDNGSGSEDSRALLRAARARPGHTVVPWVQPFNWSQVNNAAARMTTAELLLFLNDDVEALHAGWLDELVTRARRPELGLVGAQLLYPDGRLQHYGVVMGMTGFAGHLLQGCLPEAPTRCGPTAVDRNCASVTGACLLVRRELFDALGGFDESLVLCGSDVALGLAAMDRGLRNVVTPRARLLHRESVTRGSAVPAADFARSLELYDRWLRAGDPYYNPNLSLRDTRARLRFLPEDMLAVARRHVAEVTR